VEIAQSDHGKSADATGPSARIANPQGKDSMRTLLHETAAGLSLPSGLASLEYKLCNWKKLGGVFFVSLLFAH
jgi:hypothetical protein